MTNSAPSPAETRCENQQFEDLEDAQLVATYLEGNPPESERAFSELYDRYNRRLVNFAAKKLGDRDAAQDVVAEAWRKATAHLHRFDGDKGAFGSWIYTICNRLVINQYRSRDNDPQIDMATLEKNVDEDDRGFQWEDETYLPDSMAQGRQIREAVEEALLRLEPYHRRPLRLYHLQGKMYKQIAEELSLPIGTVKSRICRACARFRDAWEEMDPDVDAPLPEEGEDDLPDVSALASLAAREAHEIRERARDELPARASGLWDWLDDVAADYGVSRSPLLHALRGEGAYSGFSPDLTESLPSEDQAA